MIDFQLQRLGQIMEPQPGNPLEVEGVLNPAAVRGPDGRLYLFPRLVGPGNYSRIGIARVRFDQAGDPTGIDRRDDLGSPDRFDVYYGMADHRIGVARLDVPDSLPPGGIAEPPQRAPIGSHGKQRR